MSERQSWRERILTVKNLKALGLAKHAYCPIQTSNSLVSVADSFGNDLERFTVVVMRMCNVLRLCVRAPFGRSIDVLESYYLPEILPRSPHDWESLELFGAVGG